ENLGIEADLAERYGVGRDVLRQAVTLVVRGGLAEVRRGREGGLIVAAPTEAAASAALRSYLDLSPINLGDVLAARRQFEDLALQLAIRRQTEEQVADYLRLLAPYDDTAPARR